MLDFIFVNLDPDAAPIAEFWPGLEEHVLATSPDVKNYTLSDSVSALHPVDLQANWKIHVMKRFKSFFRGYLGDLQTPGLVFKLWCRQYIVKALSYRF